VAEADKWENSSDDSFLKKLMYSDEEEESSSEEDSDFDSDDSENGGGEKIKLPNAKGRPRKGSEKSRLENNKPELNLTDLINDRWWEGLAKVCRSAGLWSNSAFREDHNLFMRNWFHKFGEFA
jgi:hypothetical protein